MSRFRVLVYIPLEKGILVDATEDDFRLIVEGNWKKYTGFVADTYIIENIDLENLPHHRGYHGRVIIVGRDVTGNLKSLTKEQIRMVRQKLDKDVSIQSPNEFLGRLFHGQTLQSETYEYDIRGKVIRLNNYALVTLILSSKDMVFLKKMEKYFKRVSLFNQDVNFHLRQLADEMVEKINDAELI